MQSQSAAAPAALLCGGEEHELGQGALVTAFVLIGVDIVAAIIGTRSADERSGAQSAATATAAKPSQRYQPAEIVVIVVIDIRVIAIIVLARSADECSCA